MKNRAILLAALILLLQAGCAETSTQEASSARLSSSNEASISRSESVAESGPEFTQQERETLEKEYLESLFSEESTPDLEVVALHTTESSTVTISGSAPVRADTVKNYNGDFYRRKRSFWSLYNDDDIFFLASPYGLIFRNHQPGDLLYYQTGGKMIRLLENISEISSADARGMYLIRMPPVDGNSGVRPDYKAIAGSCFVYYTPTDGKETPLLENVLAAYPVPGSQILYYATSIHHDIPDEEQFNRDYILQLRRLDTATGMDTIVFTDNGIRQSSAYPVWYAFDAFFSESEGGLEFLLYYPYESEVPAWRILTLNPDTGEILEDDNPYEMHFDKLAERTAPASQSEAASTADDPESTDPLHAVKQSIVRKEYAIDGYTVIVEGTTWKDFNQRHNFYRKNAESEVYLGSGSFPVMTESGYLAFKSGGTTQLYAGGQVIYSLQGDWRIRKSGSFAEEFPFPDDFVIIENLSANSNCYLLYGRDNDVEMRLLYEIESFPSGDVPDGPGRFSFWIGNFLLLNTDDNGCFIVCHAPSGAVCVANGDGMTIRMSQQNIS